MNIDILSENQLVQLRQLISQSSTIIVTGHASPDGDAIGSCLGWAEYLRHEGKDVTIIVPDQYPDFLKWLPNQEKIMRYDKHREQCDLLFRIADLIFCLDYNTPSRVQDMEGALRSATCPLVLIDHHLSPDVPAALTISHPEASSTCELVFRVVWQLGAFQDLNKHFSVPIYCGMMTDTGGFTYNSARSEIYHIIAELLTTGIDKDRIYRNVYHNYSEDRLRLMGYVLYEKMVYLPDDHAAYYTLTREEMQRFHYVKGDSEGLVNLPQQIKGLKLSVSLREDTEKDNTIWVSLRSVDDFPCNKMSELFFNGGGHLNASGGRLNCTMDEAVATLRRAIEHFSEQLRA
ncbi:MAG: DHH family phosphoesterase [Prevotella sp.]|nr:DHH family phosphoesterase [Prevotella sp.]